MKRILSLILTLLMVLGVFAVLPTNVSAANWGALAIVVYATSPESYTGKVTDVKFIYTDPRGKEYTGDPIYTYQWRNEKGEVIAENEDIYCWFPEEFEGKRFTLKVTIKQCPYNYDESSHQWAYVNLSDVSHGSRTLSGVVTDRKGKSVFKQASWGYGKGAIDFFYTFEPAAFPVRNHSLSVVRPEIGDNPDLTGYTVSNDFVIESITWKDDTDFVILTPYAEFKEDHVYTAIANVSHLTYRYFPTDMTDFVFNGCTENAIAKYSEKDGYVATYQIYHTFPPLTPDPTTVNELEISLTEPEPGEKPDYSAVVPEGKGYAVDSEGGVMWFNVTDDDTYIDPNSDYVFEPYKEYRAMISLVTTGNDYKFAAKNRLAKLNGMEVGFSDYGWNEDSSVYVESYYVCAPEGGTAIREVEVEMDEPAAGDMPYYYAMTDSDLYRITDAEDDDDRFISGGIGWYNENDLSDMAYTDRFEEGKTYKWSVRLTSTGFSFAPADEISAKINGKTAHVKRLSDRSVMLWTYFAMPGSILPVIEQKTDQATGIIVEALSDTSLEVEVIDTGSVTVVVDGNIVAAYDISLKKNGETVQPDGDAAVSIPCDDPDAKVYRVEADNSLTDMHAVYMGGYLVFITDHFSLYVIESPEAGSAILGDVDGDGVVTILDATAIQRRLADIPTSSYIEAAADADEDNEVTIADVTAIQCWLADLGSNDHIGKKIG